MELTTAKYKSIDALPEYYSRLLEDGGRADYFSSIPWFLNFERTIACNDGSPVVYGVESGARRARALGALLMWHRTPYGPYGPTVLHSMANYYTPHFQPIVAKEYSAEVVPALARALWLERKAFSAIDLRGLDPSTPLFSSFANCLRNVGFVVQTYYQFGNWYLEVGGRSYDEYFSSLPSVLKKNIPYYSRRLERTYQTQFKIITGTDGLEKGVDDYEAVYSASWRGAESHPNFIRGLAKTAAQSGTLRLGLLYADAAPVAAQLWLVHNGTASIYKIAYVENHSKLSLGNVLTSRMMQYVIDTDKVDRIDYLSGDDSYKRNWMSHRRERWGILALNPRSIFGLTMAAKHLCGRWVRDVTRIVEP